MSTKKTAEPPQRETRDKLGRFAKGTTGNTQRVGGRPKLKEEFKRFAHEKSVEALQDVYFIMKDINSSNKDKLTAARIIIESGFGKPANEYDNERLSIERERLELEKRKVEADLRERGEGKDTRFVIELGPGLEDLA